MSIPIGKESADLVERKAIYHDGVCGETVRYAEIPEDMKSSVEKYIGLFSLSTCPMLTIKSLKCLSTRKKSLSRKNSKILKVTVIFLKTATVKQIYTKLNLHLKRGK